MQFSTVTYSIKLALWWFQNQNWTNLFPPSVSACPTQNFQFVIKLKKLVLFEYFNIHVSWRGSILVADKIKIITRKLKWFWCTCYNNLVRRVSVLEKREGKYVKNTCKNNKPQKIILDKCLVRKYAMIKWFSHMMYLIMEFHIYSLVLIIYSLKCMRAVTIHMTIPIWNASVRKQKHDLMCRFWSQGEEVPEHVTILQHTFIYKSQNMS